MKLGKDKDNGLLCACGNNYFEEVKLRKVDVSHVVNWANEEYRHKNNSAGWGQEIPRGIHDGATHALKCCSCGKLITAADIKESGLKGD